MKLNIRLYNEDAFVENYLPDVLLTRFDELYNADEYKNLDDYLKNVMKLDWTSYDVINEALSNLLITKKSETEYTIEINPNIVLDDDNRTSIISVVKLIDFGNLEVKGTMIITKIFKYISDNILDIFNNYKGM